MCEINRYILLRSVMTVIGDRGIGSDLEVFGLWTEQGEQVHPYSFTVPTFEWFWTFF